MSARHTQTVHRSHTRTTITAHDTRNRTRYNRTRARVRTCSILSSGTGVGVALRLDFLLRDASIEAWSTSGDSVRRVIEAASSLLDCRRASVARRRVKPMSVSALSRATSTHWPLAVLPARCRSRLASRCRRSSSRAARCCSRLLMRYVTAASWLLSHARNATRDSEAVVSATHQEKGSRKRYRWQRSPWR
jgi:hypothetical protein